jgi:hypothetical protein
VHSRVLQGVLHRGEIQLHDGGRTLLPRQNMFPVNTNIIVQNIQLLGINSSVQNSLIFMTMVYEIIYSVTS